MTPELDKFLNSIKEGDFKGSKTKKSLKDKAESFLNSGYYVEYESYNGYDVHNLLLCLIYDEV